MARGNPNPKPSTATQFKKGQVANPAGRPKGSRHVFGEKFVRAFTEDFDKHGAEVIATVREGDPSTYLRVAAQIVPQVIDVMQNDQALTLEQKIERIRQLDRDIERALASGLGDRGTDQRDEVTPLSPVH